MPRSPPLSRGAPCPRRLRVRQRWRTEIGWHHEPSSRERARVFVWRRVVLTATTRKTRELVPVVRERLADLETPVSAFAKLRPLGGAFLLESVEGGERMGRYSFIGVLPRATLVFRAGVASMLDADG